VAAGPEASARALLEERGWSPGQPLVAIAPGAAYGAAKRWPADHAAVVVAALEGRGVRTVLVGAGADRDAARAIESAVARGVRGVPRPLDLVGATDLAQLMGVMACCRLVVSNDSGAMHVASAVGRPVVAVFGPTDETATAPLGPHTIVRHDVWCRPCLLRECPLDHACMREVRPDMVIEAVTRWLRQDRHEEQA
jgi:heptosyltransferase-2